MSFSKNSKIEIINSLIEKRFNASPFLYGLFLALGEREDDNVCFLTDLVEMEALLKKILKLNSKDFNEQSLKCEIVNKVAKNTYFKISVKFGLLKNIALNINFDDPIQINCEKILTNTANIKAFCTGAFLGCATSSIKISERPENKTTSGYHLEFDSKNLDFLQILNSCFEKFNIVGKIIKRKLNFVLYFKDAEQVSDILALVGANESVMTLQNEIVKREFRNKINRQTNCESGNISKMVNASIKQIEAISKIENTIGLSSLAPDLEDVALLRLANPEESLNDLLKLSTLNLTKSGLNHRLRKLISIAEKLS